MNNAKENKKDHLKTVFDLLIGVFGVFGTILFKSAVGFLICGTITCILFCRILFREFGKGGLIIGVAISVGLMGYVISQMLTVPADTSSDMLSEDTRTGDLELEIEELIVGYRDQDGNKKITAKIDVDKNMCESIVLKNLDYDVMLESYKVREGKMIFSDIPMGTYDVRVQIDGFSPYSGTIKLKETDLSDGVWSKTVCVQTDIDYRELQVIILNNEGDPLKEYRCDLSVLGTNYEIKDMISVEDGKLPYIFNMPSNMDIQLTLHYDNEENYVNTYSVSEEDNPLYAQFSTPPKEKISVTEMHQPDDAATIVTLPEWNVDEDMGIDGKRYGGGIKISISDMFIAMGSNGSKDVTSRIVIPLDGNYDETVFEGVFILDQSMFGSNSTGTISVLINNEEVFTTGEIGGNTLNAFPFKVDFGDADSLVILTEAHLSGSDFVCGFVSEK